jgi:hypothetical protein
MCFEPTKEETARSEARRAPFAAPDRTLREDPSKDPEPRGNQELDELEVERSTEKLVAVLGH